MEVRLREEMGKKLGVEKVHAHKFRRTMATRAIEKGMPIEQVKKMLTHCKCIEFVMNVCYYIVKKQEVT